MSIEAYNDSAIGKAERDILRTFFESIRLIEQPDSSISDSQLVRVTRNQLRNTLRGSPYRCTCARRTWGGPCEVCQVSDKELHALRHCYMLVRDAKKRNLTASNLQEYLENHKGRVLAAQDPSPSRPGKYRKRLASS